MIIIAQTIIMVLAVTVGPTTALVLVHRLTDRCLERGGGGGGGEGGGDSVRVVVDRRTTMRKGCALPTQEDKE